MVRIGAQFGVRVRVSIRVSVREVKDKVGSKGKGFAIALSTWISGR